jgi:hypothetical protein
MHAVYATTLDVFIILGENIFKYALKVKVPLETGKTNDFIDLGYKSGGKAEKTQDDKYYEAVQPFADKLSTNLIAYFSELNKYVLKSEGLRALQSIISPKTIGSYLDTFGVSTAAETIVANDTVKAWSDLLETIALKTSEVTYTSSITTKHEENSIQKSFDIYDNNLVSFQKEIQTFLCSIKKKHEETGVSAKRFDDTLEQELKREGLEMTFKCPLQGGMSDTQKQLNTMFKTLNNSKTNETLLQQELYYIVVMTNNIKKIKADIKKTEGASLRELKQAQVKIKHDYNALKKQMGEFQKIIQFDRNLR